jgi:hypothetical protein
MSSKHFLLTDDSKLVNIMTQSLHIKNVTLYYSFFSILKNVLASSVCNSTLTSILSCPLLYSDGAGTVHRT